MFRNLQSHVEWQEVRTHSDYPLQQSSPSPAATDGLWLVRILVSDWSIVGQSSAGSGDVHHGADHHPGDVWSRGQVSEEQVEDGRRHGGQAAGLFEAEGWEGSDGHDVNTKPGHQKTQCCAGEPSSTVWRIKTNGNSTLNHDWRPGYSIFLLTWTHGGCREIKC